MIPYYSPNYGLIDLLHTALCSQSDQKLIGHFQNLTGKKHILITSSCRSALFLAYLSLGKKGIVHVSPLTCQVALLPITVAGNSVSFHDIKPSDWTLDPVSVKPGIREDSIAVQAIHLGGFPCDMPALRKIADESGLILIEDCAQGYGSSYQGQPVGTLGDISCFTLTKNVFGLGGGILATDRKEFYDRAKALQEGFARESSLKQAHRVVNAIISTGRGNPLLELAYQRLAKLKSDFKNNERGSSKEILLKELKLPACLHTRSVAGRLTKIARLNQARQKTAGLIVRLVSPLGFQFQANEKSISSYTKLFCVHPGINSEEAIRKLNEAGLEAMHLEHKHKVYYQAKQTIAMRDLAVGHGNGLENYEKLHDHLLSLPLHENLTAEDLNQIRDVLTRAIL